MNNIHTQGENINKIYYRFEDNHCEIPMAVHITIKCDSQEGGSSSSPSDFINLHGGGGGGSYSDGGDPICCIGIIVLIILGLVLNFIFHLDFWPIVMILSIVFIVGVIALAILNRY